MITRRYVFQWQPRGGEPGGARALRRVTIGRSINDPGWLLQQGSSNPRIAPATLRSIAAPDGHARRRDDLVGDETLAAVWVPDLAFGMPPGTRASALAVLASSLALALVLAPPVGAAEPEEGTTVVRPTPSPEQWAPPSAVIGSDRLTGAGVDVPRVLQEEAGLRVTRLGGLGAFSLLSVRGSTADQVRLFLDGIPLNTAEGGPVDLSTLPLGPIGAVHVYRGSSPVLFGSSAIGGIVDIRTRGLGERKLELQVGGGSFWTRSARGFYGDGGDTAAVGISWDYSGTQGDFRYRSDNGTAFDPTDDLTLTRQNNRFDQVAGLIKAQLRPSPGVLVTVLDLLTWSRRGLPGSGLFETQASGLERTRNLLGARLEIARMPIQIALSGYVAWSRTDFRDPLFEIGLGGGRAVKESWVPGANLALRAPIALDADEDWTLTPLVTAGYRLERHEPRGAPTRLRHVLNTAAELDLNAKPLRSHLVASIRYEGALQDNADLPSVGAPVTEPNHHGASFRAALVQDSIPDTRLTLSASRALRLPSLYELHGDNGYVLGNPELVPERGLSLELSATHFATWVGDATMLKFELAGFITWTEDLIQFVQNAQNVARPENVDQARVAGVEVGVALDALRHLRARAAMTWLDTENTGAIAARSGKRLPFRPQWSVFGRLEGYHDVGTAAAGEVGIRLELDYTAGNVLDHANLVSVPKRLIIGVGAHAEFWQRQLRLDVDVRNVTGATVQDLAGFPLPGLALHVALRWSPRLGD